MNKTLLVLAAGMGSRFGGLKQIEPIGPHGEFIIDYSIYDAIRSGFNKIVFVIKEENLEIFKETIGKRIENHIKVEYAFQDMKDIPKDYNIKNRVKPLGTGHAIYSARNYINENFAIINSDDFYGYDSIKKMGEFLDKNLIEEKEHYALIGYRAINTITENGSVKRGICNIENNKLVSLDESKIEITENGLKATSLMTNNKKIIEDNTLVSMNLLGFPKEFMIHIKEELKDFLEKNKDVLEDNVEYLVPDVLTNQVENNTADVSIIETTDRWYGMTYKEDKKEVEEAIKDMIEKGIYKNNLWDCNIKNEKSCGAFILDKDKVLIIKQRNTNNFGFPKGHVEEKETEKQTALREVKEETGVDIEIISNKRYQTSYILDNNINKEVVYFLAKATNKENMQKQEKEITEMMWVDIEEVEDYLCFQNLKDLWFEAKDELKQIYHTTIQDGTEKNIAIK